MSILNWGLIQDGGAFESLVHAILYAEDAGTILFGRPGQDAGQDARSADGTVIYQAKYRQGMTMGDAAGLALEELKKIEQYRQPQHPNYKHWKNARLWALVANIAINPNDEARWQADVVPAFQRAGLTADYWHIGKLEGKLAEHVHIRDVFFGGENRVLVGLKEAHDLLSAGCIGSGSFEKPMIGREDELQAIMDFAKSADKRVLPVAGPGGIGKSRLLYEGLVALGLDGWRVFWALPGTMARSSRWFHLLNGSQPTCVAIDDPDDPGLLRAVIEQLVTAERRNWKVIVACRSSKSEMLQRYRNNLKVANSLILRPLNEAQAKDLLRANLTAPYDEAFLHSVYVHMGAVPGWLCMVAELANQGLLPELPSRADEVAAAYVESCVGSLDSNMRQPGRMLLRWLVLWGVLKLDTDAEEHAELRFLSGMGIPESVAREILRGLVTTGLVHNWGVGKRLYAVEPLIIREYILDDWLLREENGIYRVSADGKKVVDQLVRGKVPAVDRALGTLSHMTLSRLEAPAGMSFLKPIFGAIATLGRDGTVLDQYRVVELVKTAGAADPESALDVLIAVRESPQEDMEVDVPLWGPQTFTHASVVSKLPWILFQIAEYVSDSIVARRYLTEFQKLIALEEKSSQRPESGKGARELLERLLCRSRNSELYAQPAREVVEAELDMPASWSFVGLLLKSLLNPERESTDWVSDWTLAITRRAFVPGSDEWKRAADLRTRVFELLRTSGDPDLRSRIWQILAESHHQFHRIAVHGPISRTDIPSYRKVLFDDLSACADILQSPSPGLTLEEAIHAREVWSWYLEHGRDDDLRDLARQCERVYDSLSQWRLHDFFRFNTDEALAPETRRVADILRTASSVDTFREFFTEAQHYLRAARQGNRDMADSWRISVLADSLSDLFTPDAPINTLTSCVLTTLKQDEDENELTWHFAIRICQRYLRRIKEKGDETAIGKELERLLALSHERAKFLFGLYQNAHPSGTGNLTVSELTCILKYENEFNDHYQRFWILGIFTPLQWEPVLQRLSPCLAEIEKAEFASGCLDGFIRALHISVLRFELSPEKEIVEWIVESIMKHNLNGQLLESYDLIDLRDRSGFRLGIKEMVRFIHSRLELEKRPKTEDSFRIMPHDFRVNGWCEFDETKPEDVTAFLEFCRLSLSHSFTALYWMPKYVAQLDPSGRHVGTFVEQYLRETPSIDPNILARVAYLASAYPETSEAWATIAHPICQKTQKMRREEREHVYFGLTRKETGVLTIVPGEVPDYYLRTRDNVARTRDAEPQDSPLRDYREWALRRAEAVLQQEQERAEENANG